MQNYLWNYLKGYVNIRIDGLSVEKFINMAVTRKIHLKNVKRLSRTSMMLMVSIPGFFALRPVAKRLKLKISIVNKNGYPFIANRLKRRKMFGLGLILCLLFVIYMSSFIWVINVSGNKKVSKFQVEQELAKYGVKPGAFKYNIDTLELERKLLIDLDKVAWVGIKIKGTMIDVSIVEKTTPPEIIRETDPTNIVAAKDAVIDEIITFQGDPVVKDGDTVKKGQVLVTGIIQRENIPTRYIHSKALIKARTWYEADASIPVKDSKYLDTGRAMTNLSMKFNNFLFPFYVRKIPYKYYDKETQNIKVLKWRDIIFPVTLIKEIYKEKKLVVNNMTDEQAKKKAEDIALERAFKMLPRGAIILEKRVEHSSINNGVAKAKVMLEVREDVIKQEKIDVKEGSLDKGINTQNR